MNRDAFLSDLKKVLKKHRIWLSGVLKIRDFALFDEKTSACEITEENGFYPYRDTSGPFIGFSIQPIEKPSDFTPTSVKTIIMDRDKLLANGVLSPLTKEAFHNRTDWNNHLKANGCVEIGNDFNTAHEKPIELKGDFDCRKELGEATYQVLDKYGH